MDEYSLSWKPYTIEDRERNRKVDVNLFYRRRVELLRSTGGVLPLSFLFFFCLWLAGAGVTARFSLELLVRDFSVRILIPIPISSSRRRRS